MATKMLGKFTKDQLVDRLPGCTPEIATKMISEWSDCDTEWDNIESVYWHYYADRNVMANHISSLNVLIRDLLHG